MSQIVALSSSASLVSIGLLVLLQTCPCFNQNFDPNVDDKEYLDTIQNRLHMEAMDAHHVLLNQTKILQLVTRTFIESKLKENLFKVVRERVEMELEEMANANSSEPLFSNSSRQARQDEEDDDESAKTTQRPRPGLLPQLANVVSTLFGSDVNVTGYLQEATSFLPSEISSRIITAASLIDPNRFTSTTIAPQLIVNGQVIPQRVFINGTAYEISQGNNNGLANNGLVNNGLGSNGLVNNGLVNNGVVTSGLNAGVQSTSFGQQQVAEVGVAPQPQLANVDNNNPYPQSAGNEQLVAQSRPALVAHSGAIAGSSDTQQQQQQQSINNGLVQPIASPLTLDQTNGIQQPNYNIGVDQARQQGLPNQQLSGPIPNFKVNEAFNPHHIQTTTPPASSNEDEDEDNSSSEKTPSGTKNSQDEEESAEDDLPVSRDELSEGGAASEDDLQIARDENTGGYLDEYPIVKYGLRLFQQLTSRQTIPTTTEYMNETLLEKAVDYIEDEEAANATTPLTTYKKVVQGGMTFFEGAKEAYSLLQQINKYLDRINTRLENAGYGAEEVGVEL